MPAPEIGIHAIHENVRIGEIKEFARRHLDKCPITTDIIASEPDVMSVQEFIMRVRVWLRLLDKELEKMSSPQLR